MPTATISAAVRPASHPATRPATHPAGRAAVEPEPSSSPEAAVGCGAPIGIGPDGYVCCGDGPDTLCYQCRDGLDRAA